jgi:transcription antitermination factor NusG
MMDSNMTGTNRERSEWYAVYTRHQHEKTVCENLAANGVEVFLPLYIVVRQWKDRTKHLSLPLFPCYVFLRKGSERRMKVLSTPGVHFFVEVAGRPAGISESEIDSIRKAVESNLVVEPHPFLRYGDRVRVRSGALAGVEGILVRRKSSYRLVLSADLLEKSVSVEVDAFSVEPISQFVAAQPLAVIRTPPSVYS